AVVARISPSGAERRGGDQFTARRPPEYRCPAAAAVLPVPLPGRTYDPVRPAYARGRGDRSAPVEEGNQARVRGTGGYGRRRFRPQLRSTARRLSGAPDPVTHAQHLYAFAEPRR